MAQDSEDDDFYGCDSDTEEAQTQSQLKRNSFFGALDQVDPAPHGPDGDTASLRKLSALPKLDIPSRSTSISSQDRLPRGARLALAQRAISTSDQQERTPIKHTRHASFFTEGSERIRTLSGPAPVTQSTKSISQRDLPPVPDRPSSFYGFESHHKLSHSLGPSTTHNVERKSLHEFDRRRSDTRALSMASYPASVLSMDQHTSNAPVASTSRLFDRSQLHVGEKASLLSHAKTLELYRMNAKKNQDPDITFEFASLMLTVAKEISDLEDAGTDLFLSPPEESSSKDSSAIGHSLNPSPELRSARSSFNLSRSRKVSPSSSSSSIFRASSGDNLDKELSASTTSSEVDLPTGKKNNLLREAAQLLRKLANQGHVRSQYLLADLHSQGIFNEKGKPEYDKSFPLFTLAAKHGHTNAAFKTGQCCENAWGCRKDYPKAVQWYKKASAVGHPEAMFRLGMAEIKGELGMAAKPKEGFKWLKRAAELADSSDEPPLASIEALYELGLLHEKGIEHVVFVDLDYAAECLARASELGHVKAAFKLGECYEYGKMGCPQDSALSIHYYNIAAQQDHAEACFALTAWYLIGSPGVLPQSDTEAYLWAKKAANASLPKAEYAVGYFCETGMGTPKDMTDAMRYYQRAAEHGDQRAQARLAAPQSAGPFQPRSNAFMNRDGKSGKGSKLSFDGPARKSRSDSECIVS